MAEMKPLSQIAHQHGVDYFKARAAMIRGDIDGAFRGNRLFCDPDSLERWKAAQAPEKKDDAPGAPDASTSHEAPTSERAS